ncbi:MAG: hypothetical protein IJM32_06135 [Ruminococcus sp.]|nr:hypothetical protein [Ruminococcus sp.]
MKNITKKIAAIGAAVMMMTTVGAVSASADNGHIKLYPIECAQAGRQTYVPECVTMVVTTVSGEGIIRGVRSNSTAKYDVEACGDRCTVDLWSKKGEDLIFTAQGTEGWKFVHWLNKKTGEVYSTKTELTFRTGESAELIAVFEKDHTEEIKNKYRNYPGIEDIVKLIPPIIC